jgi:hypothetical protein
MSEHTLAMMTMSGHTLAMMTMPAPVIPLGYWQIGGRVMLAIYAYPSRWKRFWAKFLLGWKWVEAE